MATNTIQVSSDGYVGGPVREVQGDGFVVLPFNRFSEVTIDGFVSPPNEVICDGVVTIQGGSGRYVTWDADSINTLSQLRISDGEKTDGAEFVLDTLTIPAEFITGTTSNLIGIAVCFDTSNIPLNQTVTFLIEKNNVISAAVSVTVTDTEWSNFETTNVLPGWLALQLPNEVAVVPGDKINIIVQAGGSHNLLVTNNATGKDGVMGRVLNAILITDLVPSSLDSRPIMVLSRLIQAGDANVVSHLILCDAVAQTAAFDALYVGLGTTLTLDPASNVTLTINKVLNIQGVLNSSPNAGKKHVIKNGIGTALYGTMNLTGSSKVRYAKTVNTTTQFSTTLILDRTVDWSVGDRLYISASDNQMGTVQAIQSVSSNVVTLSGGVGRANSVGVLVALLSRSVSLQGFSSSARFSFLARGNLNLTHAELSCTNGLYPDALSTIVFNDLSINDSQIYNYETQSTSLRVNGSISGSDLTIARCGNGVVSEGTKSLGEVLVVGAYANAVTVKNGRLTADVIAANVESGAITMSGGTSFVGDVSNYWSRSTLGVGSLIRMQGIVDSVQITDGFLKTATGQRGAVISMDAGSALNKLYAGGLSVDAPYLRADNGALYLGSGRIVESVSTAANIVALGSPAPFVRLVDEDGIAPTILVSGTLVSGSQVSNRYKTKIPEGTWEAYADPDFGNLLKVVTCQVELARIPISSGETLHLSCISKGAGRFILESAVAPDVIHEVNNVSFVADDFSTTATADGIIVVSFQADSTAYIDRLVRI